MDLQEKLSDYHPQKVILRPYIPTSGNHAIFLLCFLKNGVERIWRESHTICLEELILELNPVETKGMQEALKHVHHKQDTQRSSSENCKTEVGGKPIHLHGRKHGLGPKHCSKLRVGKR